MLRYLKLTHCVNVIVCIYEAEVMSNKCRFDPDVAQLKLINLIKIRHIVNVGAILDTDQVRHINIT